MKELNKTELKALLDIFGGTTSDRIDWLFTQGIIALDENTGKLWISLPLEIEDALDPTITRF